MGDRDYVLFSNGYAAQFIEKKIVNSLMIVYAMCMFLYSVSLTMCYSYTILKETDTY